MSKSKVAVTIWFICWSFLFCDAKILGAYVLPHEGLSLSPSLFTVSSVWAQELAWKLHHAAVLVGQQIASLKPEIIFEVTSHGVSDIHRFLFYLNSFANGSAETDFCRCPPCCYDISVPMDARLSRRLTSELIAEGFNVSAVTFFPNNLDIDGGAVLRWAEVIPLLFIKEIYQGKKLVLLSQPSRCCIEAPAMVEELLKLGSSLYEKLNAISETVVFVISGALAEKHTSFNPYSRAAESFDDSCGHWASTLHPEYLLNFATKTAEEAGSCGLCGLMLLHGFLKAGKLSSWTPVLHANVHPLHRGSMVASFARKETCENCL